MIILNIQGMAVDAKSISSYKLEYLRDFLKSHKAFVPVIAITESWLKSYVSDAQINIPAYTAHRCDRHSRTRGGCLTYIHEDIPVGESSILDNRFCEAVITPLEKVQTAVINIYRPGNTPLSKFLEVINFIQNFINSVNDSWTYLISGDLNFPNIDWKNMCVTSGLSSNENASAESLLNFMEKNGFGQFIDIPTRLPSRVSDRAENTLEVLISNSSELIMDVRCEETMLSDHEWVSVSLGSDLSPTKQCDSVCRPFGFSWFNFNNADFARISSYIQNTNWNEMLIDDPDNFSVNFEQTLINICRLCVPLKSSFTEETNKKPHKPKSAITGLKRKQKRLRCRIKALEALHPDSHRISALKLKLDNVNNCIKSKLSLIRQNEEIKAASVIKSNPRYFYSFARKFSKVKRKIGPLKTGSSQFASNPKQMADIFQRQFCSVFSNPASSLIEDPSFESVSTCLEDFVLQIEDFIAAIDKMNLHSAPGEDEFPAILIKNCKESICLPLFLLWKYSFDNGKIEQRFLSQLIAPVFKGGSRLQACNYRPVSLTSHVIKIFERVIQQKIIDYLDENNLISCNQHGFRQGCSCLSELFAHFHQLYENLGNGLDSDTIYLDFSKAFDKVDHALLIKKLKLYGIKGKLLNWIKAFLSNRVQKVVVDGKVSFSELVISGVPQGTVLGPLLFLLFVNDLELVVEHSNLKLFADDSRLIKSVNPTLSCVDINKLQYDLDQILNWTSKNNMLLNETKFQLLSHHVHAYAPSINMRLLLQLPFAECQYERSYTLPNGLVLSRESSVQDLGICISDDFSFQSHINQISQKANLKCSWILSVFQSRESNLMLTLFKSLILNILEYCCPLWSPHRIQDIAKIEAVQRRFTSKISAVANLNYWDRLKALRMFSLQRRRERYLLIYLWKIINGKVPNDVGITWHNHIRRGVVVDIPRIPSTVAKINSACDNFFTVKAAKLWNCIPSCVNTKTSLLTFKANLDCFLLDVPDCPPVAGYTTGNSNSLLAWISSSN